ncbi:MAG: glycosyltransferase family 2 protein [Acetobacter indonesiensis]|jgi:glycosyltransferase involved in cell wall biosynthesis|nr:glycosyltransferase family 2 protein [Acetobacter indonesiensis]MCI1546440.1 glycosyltransferase family 2 protein [Acetobacter indonesiensis]MCI1765783.1 glycosyltransferase family 2 protein [Acetobacter indonesiensis]
MSGAFRFIVLIPSYNSGELLHRTVAEVLTVWPDVVVVSDGSQDGSQHALDDLLPHHGGLHLVRLQRNGGKGRAVLYGAQWAAQAGFTHILTMDADGQHPARYLPEFMAESRQNPQAMILGKPVFGPDAPALRVWGRKLSNGLVWLETAGAVKDCLFGFRVYPLPPFLQAMQKSRFMRGFDFDPEIAVRLVWMGVPTVNKPAPVQYLEKSDGGISHFQYGRDNARLTFMHIRLFLTWLWRMFCGKQKLFLSTKHDQNCG